MWDSTSIKDNPEREGKRKNRKKITMSKGYTWLLKAREK